MEAGLPNDTLWYVTANGTTYSSSNEGTMMPYIQVSLGAGTYNFSVGGPEEFNATPSSGTIALSRNENVSVRFAQTERASSTSTSGTLDLVSNAQVSVPYVVQYAVSFESMPGNGGTTYPNETEWVSAGSGIQIQATPSKGYRFVGWATNYSISFENASSPYTMATVNSAGVIAAEFKQIPSYTLEYAIAATAIILVVIVAALERTRRRRGIGLNSRAPDIGLSPDAENLI